MSWYELWVAEQLRRALWVLGILIAVALAGLWLYGCAPAPKAPEAADFAVAAACHEVIERHIATDATCKEAEAAINADAACKLAAPKGFSLNCKEDRR